MADEFINVPGNEQDEWASDILTLEDENGVEQEFELVDSLDYNDNRYVALVPLLEDEDDEENGELVLLRADYMDEDEEFLVIIEDEDEFNQVADLFMQRLKDDYEISE